MKAKALFIILMISIFWSGCESLTGPSIDNKEQQQDQAPAQIVQLADRINGLQGESVIFSLKDYFDSEAAIEIVDFKNEQLNISAVGEDSFRVSQPYELTGTVTIETFLRNADDQSLDTELSYVIEPAPVEPPPAEGTLIMMPLGDSMTNDSRSRVVLWNALTEDDYELDYVGNQNQRSSIPDPDHEGVGGIEIQGIFDKASSLMIDFGPDYVLLMVGTNDIAWYFDETGQEIADRWNQLIQEIYDNSGPDTYIIAATIPPMSSQNVGKSDMTERDRAVLTAQYNEALREHIENRISNGDNIVLADMYEALDPSAHLSSDGVHLNSDGYAVMGSVYHQAMLRAMQQQQ